MGYNVIASEGKTFKNALSDIQSLIDKKTPVILFGLDMFHLPYQENFYHRMHIPGHIILMVGYDDNAVYIHDNSKACVQIVPYEDLQLAWQNDYLNISKKNAYFGIDLIDVERDTKSMFQNSYQDTAACFLNPAVGFCGIKGIDRLIKEFPSWKNNYEINTLKAIYTHFVRFTGSVLPELPAELDKNQSGLINPHRGLRDSLAASLIKYNRQFGNDSWIAAAAHFNESGKIIEKIVDGFVADIINSSFSQTDKYVDLFCKLKKSEEEAYLCITKN